MAKKPSERRNFKEEGMELNLTPMINLIAILIPVLLVSTAFVELAVLNVAAPAIGSAPEQNQQDKPPDKPPLNLTLTITGKGYTLAGSGGVLGAPEGADGKGPTIPLVQKMISCRDYVDTWPPPRSKNRSSPRCKNGNDERSYWTYDLQTLANKLIEIKDTHPDERRIIIAAEADVEYETITNAMDASREHKDAGGETRTLFDEVVLSPGMS
jgi:biopolymer transport protein ExbD